MHRDAEPAADGTGSCTLSSLQCLEGLVPPQAAELLVSTPKGTRAAQSPLQLALAPMFKL